MQPGKPPPPLPATDQSRKPPHTAIHGPALFPNSLETHPPITSYYLIGLGELARQQSWSSYKSRVRLCSTATCPRFIRSPTIETYSFPSFLCTCNPAGSQRIALEESLIILHSESLALSAHPVFPLGVPPKRIFSDFRLCSIRLDIFSDRYLLAYLDRRHHRTPNLRLAAPIDIG